MPDPRLYFQAIGSAALISMIIVLAIGSRRASISWWNTACVLGISFGLASGCYALALRPVWPPASALDRLLVVVVPAALLIEWIAGFQSVPVAATRLLRIILAIAAPRILLHGSVYLSGADAWTFGQAAATIAVCGLLLAGVWGLLLLLSDRSGGVSIPFALCLAIQSSGMTVMMAGYINGGAAAYLFAATLVGATLGLWLITRRRDTSDNETDCANFNSPTILGIGTVSLFGLLFIGLFFGRISTATALTILLAPLLCWATEVPPLKNHNRWIAGTLRLALVATPLVVVLIMAKYEFEREMSPLLGNSAVPASFSDFF
jgi:hypothetical protein